MNATFTPPRHSKSSCCLAPTPPTRKGSRPDFEKVSRTSSVPTQLLACYGESTPLECRNAVFVSGLKAPRRGSLQREKRLSPCTSLKAASFMMLDHTSRPRTATATSIGITRANSSCDRMPSMPVRMHSPVKARRQVDAIFPTYNDSTCTRNSGHVSHTEQDSAVIRKPDIKSNMFLQNMKSTTSVSKPSKQARSSRISVSKTNSESHTQPTAHIKTLRLGRSRSSIMDAALLGASELSDTDHHRISRWDSSPTLSFTIRRHESLSSSLEFFLNGDEVPTSQ